MPSAPLEKLDYATPEPKIPGSGIRAAWQGIKGFGLGILWIAATCCIMLGVPNGFYAMLPGLLLPVGPYLLPVAIPLVAGARLLRSKSTRARGAGLLLAAAVGVALLPLLFERLNRA